MAKIITFTGTAEWAKLSEDNRDLGDDQSDKGKKIADNGGQYSLNFYFDDPEVAEATMIANKVSMVNLGYPVIKENDGRKFIKPFRYHNPTVTRNGQTITGTGGPPRVIDSEGNDWDPEVLIGNGSQVMVAIELYPANNKMFMRLKGVRVDELVEYDAGKDVDVADVMMAAG